MKNGLKDKFYGFLSPVSRSAITGCALFAVVLCLVCAVPAQSSAADTQELSMASLFPPESPSSKSLNRWAERVEKESNGRLTVRHYPANTLIPAPDMRTGVRAGVADIGCSFIYKPEPGFDPSMMLSQLILGLSYENCLHLVDDIWGKFPKLWESQWKDFKLLWITTIDPNLLVTVGKGVKNLDDMKGLQIRIPTAMSAQVIKRLGGKPVSMSSGDWIISLDKGTTDGAATSLGSLLDYKIGEKVDYVTRYSLGPGVFFLAMNKDTWNDLSPEMQQVIEKTAEWGRQDIINTKKKSVEEAIEYLKSYDVKFIDLPSEEHEKWNKTIKPVFNQIAADLDAKGYPGTELVDYALERAEFYSKQQ